MTLASSILVLQMWTDRFRKVASWGKTVNAAFVFL